jgi:hypothetical protein
MRLYPVLNWAARHVKALDRMAIGTQVFASNIYILRSHLKVAELIKMCLRFHEMFLRKRNL